MKSDDKTDESCLLYEWAVITETAALWAAILALLGCGEIKNMNEIAHIWKQDKQFLPEIAAIERAAILAGWQKEVKRTVLD